MSRFNKTQKNVPTATNLAGGEAYEESAELELISILLTSFAREQFYRSADNTLKRIETLISQLKDKKFAAKAAVFARTQFGMRSITHVVAGEIAKQVKGEQWTRPFFDKVVYRADDITEILAYYINKYGKPLPNSLKDGLARAVNKFDGYQLAKYAGNGKDLGMIDVFNLIHPKPNEKNVQVFKDLMAGKLKNTETWEAKLSEAGKADSEDEVADAKEQAWKELISEKKLGLFALLRNLRNIITQAPEMVDEACNQLTNEVAIKKSLILPFRFMTAIKEIEKVYSENTKLATKVLKALNKALDISVNNVPELEGETLIALDVSGSMTSTNMGKNYTPAEIGALFAAAIHKRNPENSVVLTFDDRATIKRIDTDNTLTSIVKAIDFRGGGTDFNCIFDKIREGKMKFDRIIILSDMQMNIGSVGNDGLKDYKKSSKINPSVFSFDLQGYGSLQFKGDKHYQLSGFSEKVFDVIKLLETDKNALINSIYQLEL